MHHAGAFAGERLLQRHAASGCLSHFSAARAPPSTAGPRVDNAGSLALGLVDAPACEAWHVILLEAKWDDDDVADHVLRPVFISHPEQLEQSVV